MKLTYEQQQHFKKIIILDVMSKKEEWEGRIPSLEEIFKSVDKQSNQNGMTRLINECNRASMRMFKCDFNINGEDIVFLIFGKDYLSELFRLCQKYPLN
jgi:hypothetical protein